MEHHSGVPQSRTSLQDLLKNKTNTYQGCCHKTYGNSCNTILKGKHGGGSIMYQGCFSSTRTGGFCQSQGNHEELQISVDFSAKHSASKRHGFAPRTEHSALSAAPDTSPGAHRASGFSALHYRPGFHLPGCSAVPHERLSDQHQS